ncbi:hypothetical protein ACLOJK_033057 [Asimina triloba]
MDGTGWRWGARARARPKMEKLPLSSSLPPSLPPSLFISLVRGSCSEVSRLRSTSAARRSSPSSSSSRRRTIIRFVSLIPLLRLPHPSSRFCVSLIPPSCLSHPVSLIPPSSLPHPRSLHLCPPFSLPHSSRFVSLIPPLPHLPRSLEPPVSIVSPALSIPPSPSSLPHPPSLRLCPPSSPPPVSLPYPHSRLSLFFNIKDLIYFDVFIRLSASLFCLKS